MYWHLYVEPGLGSLLYFLSVPWKMYTFSCCFSVVAQSNIRQWPVLLQNHPPQLSIQSNHIAPPNWNLFSFITWSQRCDRRRIHAFPLHFSVLNLYPHRSPSIPTMATNWSPPFVMVATYWHPSTPPPVANMCCRLLGYNWHPCYVWVQRHDTSPRDFVHIFPVIVSSVRIIAIPAIVPLFQHPFLPYVGHATPSHAHHIISFALCTRCSLSPSWLHHVSPPNYPPF